MKKLFSLLLALTLVVTCLAGVSFAADPVARIINGDKVVELEAPLQDEKFEALISPEGTTVIEILKDFRTSEFGMWSPYTVTIDLKGHKITTGRNGLHVEAAGSVNSQTVIKNGTINSLGALGIRIQGGSVLVDNCTVLGTTSNAFGLYSTDGGNAVLKNSTFVSKALNAVGFHVEGKDQSKSTIEIENCTLITVSETNSQVLGSRASVPGTFKLGKGVKMYTYRVETPCNSKAKYEGEAYTFVEGLQNVLVEGLNTTYYDLNMWTAPEYVAPTEPATPAEPATPSVPTTNVPDVNVPKTGASVIALGVMAMVSLAGAVVTKKH